MKYILITVYIILTTSGLFCLKSGGNMILSLRHGLNIKMTSITFLGFICYLFSFLLLQKLLSTYDLSFVVPVTTGIIQSIVILIGYFFFHESMSLVNVIGIILVIAGIVLISIKLPR